MNLHIIMSVTEWNECEETVRNGGRREARRARRKYAYTETNIQIHSFYSKRKKIICNEKKNCIMNKVDKGRSCTTRFFFSPCIHLCARSLALSILRFLKELAGFLFMLYAFHCSFPFGKFSTRSRARARMMWFWSLAFAVSYEHICTSVGMEAYFCECEIEHMNFDYAWAGELVSAVTDTVVAYLLQL